MGRGGYDTTDASSAGSSAAQYALATHQALVGPQTLPGITIEFDKHVQLMEAKANAEAEAAKANAKTEAAKHAAEEAKGAEEPKGGAASAAHIERTTATKQ